MKKMYTHVFFLAKKHYNYPQILPLLIGVVLMLLPFLIRAQTKVVIMPASPYTTSNITTWQVPANVYYITVECIGGGGGGSSGYNGGSGGGYSYKAMSVTPNTTYYIQAGGAGSGGTSGNVGGNGGISYMKTGSHSGTVVVLANGGTGGNKSNPGPAGGSTSGAVGDLSKAGGAGGDVASSKASGGGGAGGFGGDGVKGISGSNGTWTAASGGPGNPYSTRGKGGRSCDGCTNGWTGEWYGGGGGGSTGSANTGGNGGPGAVIITYTGALITPITNAGNDVLCSGTTTQLNVNLPTGGTITTPSIGGTDYRVHSFTTPNQFDFFNSGGNIGQAEALIVGGGGGGGRNGGGGGGAGEFISIASNTLAGQNIYPVFVGDGGGIGYTFGGKENTGYRGGISYFNGKTANGGGGGANRDGGGQAMTGGSGGGGSNAGGSGWPEQNGNVSSILGSGSGNNGGNGEWSTSSWSWYGGGGGGGGAVGTSTSGQPRNTPGNGGNGITSSITGTSVEYAAGGGGSPCCIQSGFNTYPAKGGSNNVGGGNNGSNQLKGPNPNTGSGGYGGGSFTGINSNNVVVGSAGADGIVIIRYPKGVWSSNATGVATVDQTGKVTAVAGAGGTATISYTIGGQTYGTYDITVAPQFTSGTLASTSQTICYNTQPADISYTTAPAAGTLVAGKTATTYQWYKINLNTAAVTGPFVQASWVAVGSPITAPAIPNLTGATIGNITSTTTFELRITTTVTNGTTTTCYDNWAGNAHVVTVQSVPTAGAIAASNLSVCPSTSVSLTSTTAGTGSGTITYLWEYSTDGATYNTFSGTGASNSYTVTQTTWFRRTTISTQNTKACNSVPTTSVIVSTNDAYNGGTIATASSSQQCVVADASWHYFRNSAGEVIAAVNSNGDDLGNVTLSVTINTAPYVYNGNNYLSDHWGNGGIGNAKVCLGQPELSMRRWYEISSDNAPSAHSTNVRFFFTPSDYSNYTAELATWKTDIAPQYDFCYGYTAANTDLAVSKDEMVDVPVFATNNNVTTLNGVIQYELVRPSFSKYRFHTNGGWGQPLPVEMVSFTGFNEGGVNKLQWITASEFNTNRFVVEKRMANGTWSSIGAVPAAGNSNIERTYSFNDIHPAIGENYYRIKTIDKDSTFSYSVTINVAMAGVYSNGITKVYPNPTDGLLNIEIQANAVADTKVSVYSLLGAVIAEKSTTLIKGINTLQFDFKQLAKGTYMLRYIDGSGTMHTTKFVKD